MASSAAARAAVHEQRQDRHPPQAAVPFAIVSPSRACTAETGPVAPAASSAAWSGRTSPTALQCSTRSPAATVPVRTSAGGGPPVRSASSAPPQASSREKTRTDAGMGRANPWSGGVHHGIRGERWTRSDPDLMSRLCRPSPCRPRVGRSNRFRCRHHSLRQGRQCCAPGAAGARDAAARGLGPVVHRIGFQQRHLPSPGLAGSE